MANIMDLIKDWRITVENNENISTLYIAYQVWCLKLQFIELNFKCAMCFLALLGFILDLNTQISQKYTKQVLYHTIHLFVL